MKIVLKNSSIKFESFPWDNILSNGTLSLTDNGITHSIVNGNLVYTRVGTSVPCLSVVNNMDRTKAYKVKITVFSNQNDAFVFGELESSATAEKETFNVTTSPKTFVFNQAPSHSVAKFGFDFRDSLNGSTFTITEFSIFELDS